MSKVLEIIRERIKHLEKDIEELHVDAAKWSMYEFDEDRNPYYDYMDKDEAKIKDLKELESYLMEDEKKLEAFEIIKKKNVLISNLKISNNLVEYNRWVDDESILTQEEFELLKEVLWNEHN